MLKEQAQEYPVTVEIEGKSPVRGHFLLHAKRLSTIPLLKVFDPPNFVMREPFWKSAYGLREFTHERKAQYKKASTHANTYCRRSSVDQKNFG
jgi:hypothetical protein